jgi:hypothetical protein
MEAASAEPPLFSDCLTRLLRAQRSDPTPVRQVMTIRPIRAGVLQKGPLDREKTMLASTKTTGTKPKFCDYSMVGNISLGVQFYRV